MLHSTAVGVRAERLYRRVLAHHPDDMEAWRQLGETFFHYNPLRGRSIGEARQPFERVVALDPGNYAALWHLALIAASERRIEAFDRLTGRLLELGPGRDEAVRVRALRAVAAEGGVDDALASSLRAMHHLDTYDVVWWAAVHLHDLEAAERIATLLTAPGRHPIARRVGHEALAYLELARGRREGARRHIDALTRLDTRGSVTLELRAAVALSPLDCVPTEDVAPLRVATLEWRPGNAIRRVQRFRLLGMLSVAAGDTTFALEFAAALDDAVGDPARPVGELSGAMELAGAAAAATRARVARRAGRPADALRMLNPSRVERWFGWAVASPVQSQAAERYLRAELLREAGRHGEALRWYATFGEHGVHDVLYLAPSHLRRAEIYERLGDREAARRHYGRFVELWDEADPPLRACALARSPVQEYVTTGRGTNTYAGMTIEEGVETR